MLLFSQKCIIIGVVIVKSHDVCLGKEGYAMHYDFSNMGENIALLRRRISMTQEMLADRLGVSAQAVSKWERGLSCPDVSFLPVMAEIFGVSIDELFVRAEPDGAKRYVEELPWEDDNKLRIAVFYGKHMSEHEIYEFSGEEDAVLLIKRGEENRTYRMENRMKGRSKTPPE